MADTPSIGFPPVATRNARVLILGSLPGVRSLVDAQYYAQPQNAFWRIMDELIDAGPQVDYALRLERMKARRIALWDVVRSAVRPGSMDSAIRRDTIEANDFAGFFATHREIALVCFNGRTAAELWKRRVSPILPEEHARVATTVLPSTSPAYAGMAFAEKLSRWRGVLGPYCSKP